MNIYVIINFLLVLMISLYSVASGVSIQNISSENNENDTSDNSGILLRVLRSNHEKSPDLQDIIEIKRKKRWLYTKRTG